MRTELLRPESIPFLLLLTLFVGPVAAQSRTTVNPDVRPHLELLFSGSDVARLRANAQLPLFEDYWRDLLSMDLEADNNYFREAFIYVVTGDSDRGKRAKAAVLAMAKEEYWNDFVDGDKRLGFLRAGRTTAWMSLAYDWLYDLFSESERAQIRTAIAERGCVPLYRALYGFKNPDTVTGWSFAPYAPTTPRYDLDMSRWPHILANNNFRAIINGGLTLGTIVLEGHDARTSEWKAMVLESIGLFNARLKDDGSYDEAVSYLNYAMTYQLHAMEAARRKFGVNYFDTANFIGMMNYVLAMYLPSELYGNGSLTFGDAGPSLNSSTAFWVAANARDGLAEYIGRHYSNHDPLSLLYYDPTVVEEAPGPDKNFVELDLDWIVSRSGFELDDYVVGMRSGAPMNHEHGDRNSIQLKAYGEILLADHKSLTYWALDPEWEMRGSRGHNMVLIDGQGVQYHNGEEGTNESRSYARIVRAGQRDGYHFWASDATQGYRLLNDDVESVTRTIISFPEVPAVIVLDKVIKKSEPSIISSRWQVENSDGSGDISLGDGKFVIVRPNARLQVTSAGSSGTIAEAGRFESANKEHPFRFVEVTSGRPVTRTFNITVAVPLRTDEQEPTVSVARDGDNWNVTIRKDARDVQVRVLDSGTLPEFEVHRNQ